MKKYPGHPTNNSLKNIEALIAIFPKDSEKVAFIKRKLNENLEKLADKKLSEEEKLTIRYEIEFLNFKRKNKGNYYNPTDLPPFD